MNTHPTIQTLPPLISGHIPHLRAEIPPQHKGKASHWISPWQMQEMIYCMFEKLVQHCKNEEHAKHVAEKYNYAQSSGCLTYTTM